MTTTESMRAVNIPAKLPPHLGLRVLITATACGVMADLLLQATRWGLNLTFAVVGSLAAAMLLTRWGRVALEGEGRWLAVPMVCFAAALAWRDSATLNVANALTLLMA